MQEPELTKEACPFCTRDMIRVTRDLLSNKYSVTCHHCGAKGPPGHSRSMAITLWKHRPALQ